MTRQQYPAARTTARDWLLLVLLVGCLLLIVLTGLWLAFTAVRQLFVR